MNSWKEIFKSIADQNNSESERGKWEEQQVKERLLEIRHERIKVVKEIKHRIVQVCREYSRALKSNYFDQSTDTHIGILVAKKDPNNISINEANNMLIMEVHSWPGYFHTLDRLEIDGGRLEIGGRVYRLLKNVKKGFSYSDMECFPITGIVVGPRGCVPFEFLPRAYKVYPKSEGFSEEGYYYSMAGYDNEYYSYYFMPLHCFSETALAMIFLKI